MLQQINYEDFYKNQENLVVPYECSKILFLDCNVE